MSSWIGFIIVLIGIALFTAVPVLYQAVLLGLVFLLWIRWGLRDSCRKLIYREYLLGSSGFAGSKLSIRLQFLNSSWFPIFWCAVTKSFPVELGATMEQNLISIAPHSQTTIKIAFYPQRRGIYSLPVTKMTIGDPFGLKEQTFTNELKEQIIIYPFLFPIRGLSLTRHLPFGTQKVLFGHQEDPSRLRGCRDYRPGDSIKKIHWSNLARTGILKVKEWETTLAAQVGLFLNLSEMDFPVSEWFYLTELGIEFTTSLAHLMIANQETLGFYSNGAMAGLVSKTTFALPPKRGVQQEQRILHFLAGAGLNPGSDYLGLFQEASHLAIGSCLIFITPQITPAMVKRTANLSRLGYHPVFLWLHSKNATVPFTDLQQTKTACFTVEKRREPNAFFITRTR